MGIIQLQHKKHTKTYEKNTLHFEILNQQK
jgi:hypothetical protein